MDTSCECFAGMPRTSSNSIAVLVDDGKVPLEPLYKNADDDIKKCFNRMLARTLRSANDTIGAHTLLEAAWNSKEQWLVDQLVSEFSVAVEVSTEPIGIA